MTRREKYADRRPIATIGLTNYGGLELLDYIYDNGNAYVIAAYNFSDERGVITKHIVRYDDHGDEYFIKSGSKYYLTDFVRVV